LNATTAIVAAAYFLLIVYFSRRGVRKGVTSLDEFTIGGWGLGIAINVAFFTATWVSAASVLGVPGLLYANGFAIVTGWFGGWFFANALLPIIAFKIRRPEFPVRTVPEFMRLRFEPFAERSGLQVYAAVIMVGGYLSYMTIQIAGIGYVVSALTSIPYELSIFVFLVFVMITVVGGVWSVAITDLFNIIVLVIGLGVAALTILPQVGGWSEMFAQAMLIDTPATPGATAMVSGEFFSPLGSFTFGAMVGVFLSNSLGASVAPHWPTRLLSAKNVRTAVLTPMLANSILVFIFVCLLILGVGGRVLVPTMPEGLATDQIMPLLATDFMNPAVAGILLAAIFAAALSTANGMVLHIAIAGTYDIFRNLRKDRIEDRALIRLTQILLMIMAVIATLLSIQPPEFIALLATYVFAAFGTAFIAPMYIGLYWKRANRQAAWASTLIGPTTFVVLLVAVELGWYSGMVPPVLIAIGVSVVAMIVCTLVFPHAPREAWEPYFEETISPETKRVIDRAMRNIAR
jgi:sodium/pantothenate symporter